jgi:hypothetical protein
MLVRESGIRIQENGNADFAGFTDFSELGMFIA